MRSVRNLRIIMLVAVLGVASPVNGQTPASEQAAPGAFLEAGVVTGGVAPSELLHRFGACGEFGVPVWHSRQTRYATVISLRARVETLSPDNDDDDWLVSFLFAEAVQFSPRLALEGVAGYGTSRGALGTAHGTMLGVTVPVALTKRVAIVPRASTYILVGGERISTVVTFSLNLRYSI